MKVDITKIRNSISIKTYLITFSYETRKGYYREQQRLVSAIEDVDPKEVFKDWADRCRTMVKVKILGIVEMKDLSKVVEI